MYDAENAELVHWNVVLLQVGYEISKFMSRHRGSESTALQLCRASVESQLNILARMLERQATGPLKQELGLNSVYVCVHAVP